MLLRLSHVKLFLVQKKISPQDLAKFYAIKQEIWALLWIGLQSSTKQVSAKEHDDEKAQIAFKPLKIIKSKWVNLKAQGL